MNRTGLLVALAIAAIVGIVFGVQAKLDIDLSARFFDPNHRGSWVGFGGLAGDLREFARYTVAVLIAPAGLAILGKLVRPRRPMLIPGRAAVLMIATLALAPGVLANVVLKQHWGRPRPIDIVEFGGDQHFVAWWDPRGECPENCSFVAGEPSGAFWTLAPAALMPPAWRALATAAALAFGTVIGVDRMAAGGHFFTDVVFSGVFTFLVIWLAHGFIYRWGATRISDRAIERALERPVQLLRGAGSIPPPSEPADPPEGQLRPDAAKKGG